MSGSVLQIDADGRILESSGASGKLHVIDKEMKRMETEEHMLAKEEADLRVGAVVDDSDRRSVVGPAGCLRLALSCVVPTRLHCLCSAASASFAC